MSKKLQVIGHRGASGYAPENTIESFIKAEALGCKFIEFDITQSIDGELFVFHDANLKRTSNGTGDLQSHNTQYLKSLDAGMWFAKDFIGAKIPTLQEVFGWLEKRNMQINIEIKPFPGNVVSICKKLIADIINYWPYPDSMPLVSSFDYNALLLCNKYAPKLPLGWLVKDNLPDDYLDKLQRIQCKTININWRLASRSLISDLLQNNIRVNVYTVNTPALAKRLDNLGVNGIFSDYPDLLQKLAITTFCRNSIRQLKNFTRKLGT